MYMVVLSHHYYIKYMECHSIVAYQPAEKSKAFRVCMETHNNGNCIKMEMKALLHMGKPLFSQ